MCALYGSSETNKVLFLLVKGPPGTRGLPGRPGNPGLPGTLGQAGGDGQAGEPVSL